MSKNKIDEVECDLKLIMLQQNEMSVTELSENTGLNYNYICDLRNKRHLPNIYNALLIANYLNCNINDIWYLKKDKNNPE